jgi:hypothetical protein
MSLVLGPFFSNHGEPYVFDHHYAYDAPAHIDHVQTPGRGHKDAGDIQYQAENYGLLPQLPTGPTVAQKV